MNTPWKKELWEQIKSAVGEKFGTGPEIYSQEDTHGWSITDRNTSNWAVEVKHTGLFDIFFIESAWKVDDEWKIVNYSVSERPTRHLLGNFKVFENYVDLEFKPIGAFVINNTYTQTPRSLQEIATEQTERFLKELPQITVDPVE